MIDRWSSGGIDTFFLLEQHLTFRHKDRDQYETQSEEKTKTQKVQVFRNHSICILISMIYEFQYTNYITYGDPYKSIFV